MIENPFVSSKLDIPVQQVSSPVPSTEAHDSVDPNSVTVDTAQPAEVSTTIIDKLAREPEGVVMPYAVALAKPKEKLENDKYECSATQDPEMIYSARKLVADRYLNLGFVTSEDIVDGVMSAEADPYAAHSTYYVVTDPKNGEIVATSRRIHYDPSSGEKSFPLLDHKDQIDESYLERIDALGIENCVEISSLVRNPAYRPDNQVTLQLYREMFQDAWASGSEGEKVFLMACKPKLFTRFKQLFDGSMQRIGPDIDYPGEKVVPAMFELLDGSVDLIRKSKGVYPHRPIHRAVIRFMFEGADGSNYDRSILAALEYSNFDDITQKINGAPSIPEQSMSEKISHRKPEIIAAASLLGYTALRTYGVAEGVSPHTDVDWRIFLGIEALTTPSYVLGMGDMIRSAIKPELYTRMQRLKAAGLGIGSLIAPYAYVVAEGNNMPASAWTGVGAFAAVAGASIVNQTRSERKKMKNIEAGTE